MGVQPCQTWGKTWKKKVRPKANSRCKNLLLSSAALQWPYEELSFYAPLQIFTFITKSLNSLTKLSFFVYFLMWDW
jgi:hypothetical protein